MVNIWSLLVQSAGLSCPLCHAPGDGLCEACAGRLPVNTPACDQCALPLPDGAAPHNLCAGCQRRSPAFDHVIAPLRYQPPVDDLVSAFKYHHRLDLGRVLADRLWQALRVREDAWPACLLPVPMERHRLAERGFNQAAEITGHLSRRLRIPWSTRQLVRNPGPAPAQRELDRRARLRNMRGRFEVIGQLPPHVAVVDDVVTTGATVEEISRVLRRAGVERVEVWAAARTPAERRKGEQGG